MQMSSKSSPSFPSSGLAFNHSYILRTLSDSPKRWTTLPFGCRNWIRVLGTSGDGSECGTDEEIEAKGEVEEPFAWSVGPP